MTTIFRLRHRFLNCNEVSYTPHILQVFPSFTDVSDWEKLASCKEAEKAFLSVLVMRFSQRYSWHFRSSLIWRCILLNRIPTFRDNVTHFSSGVNRRWKILVSCNVTAQSIPVWFVRRILTGCLPEAAVYV